MRLLALVALVLAVGGTTSAQKQPKRSPHGPLNVACENCHTNTSWAPIRAIPEFNHNTTRYPLRGMHEKVTCTGCHTKPVFTDVGKDCASCHADIHRGQFGANCAECHTPLGWQISNQAIQNHFNRFPLLGAHAVVECQECHKNAAVGNYLGLSTACSSCHMTDYLGTTNPVHQSAGSAFAASNCSTCHAFDNWLNAKFDHSTTGFLLTNGHANVACATCHINNNYNLITAPTDCGNSQCHLTTWQTTKNPVHSAAGPTFAAAQCYSCHQSTISWSIVNFDHNTATTFPLTGGHISPTPTPCAACHVNNNYSGTLPTTCGASGCHLTTWQQTKNPPHAAAPSSFPLATCSTCHTTANWTTSTFDHSTTNFALTGTHLTTACALCHVNNNYTLSSTDCYGCHAAAFTTGTTVGGSVPNHVTAGFPITATACATCHPITTWAAGVFNHSATGFPLTNAHATVTCALCHLSNNYALSIAPTDCGNSGCHLNTNYGGGWQGTTAPPHSSAGPLFAAANCTNCHTTVSFTTATFDHSTTGFALTGTHVSPKPTPCELCHVSNNYSLSSTDCYGCHAAAFQSTTTIGGNVPNHVTAGFPTTATACATCHPITTWAAGVFDHAATGFPLTNAHATVTCALCHLSNNYALSIAPTDCGNSGCHLNTNYGGGWQGTTAPPHSSAGPLFAVANCTNCHTTVSFTTATFDHSTTGFALTGTHLSTACALCHVNNNYTLSSTDCYGCHAAAFTTGTTVGGNVPNHVTAGFPITAAQCASCHPITTWAAGVFNHSSTGFPLANSHATVACGLCHIGGNYALTIAPTDCGNSGCHLNTNYGGGWQGTTAPPHSSAGPLFAVANCTNCHTTVSFTTATWDHGTTGFALTGLHISPTPTPCASCHYGASAYSLSSAACYNCHADVYAKTATGVYGPNVPNHVSANFPQDCSICHGTSNWTTSTFNHNSVTPPFPLTGAHLTTVTCAQCHVGPTGYSGNLPTACDGCHDALYQQTATLGAFTPPAPNHLALGYPKTCDSCHTTVAWTGAVFNHSSTGFPLTGAHITTACTLCHITAAIPPLDCYSCHTAKWVSTAAFGGNVPDHTGNGFPPPSTCATCHNTTAWNPGTIVHSWWRIPHASATCQTCHQTPGSAWNFATFNCTNGCHTPESRWQQDSGRHNAGNYGPMTCTASGCHPNG